MTDFRFYCLNDKNRIIRSGDLDVLDLDAAVRDAYQNCGDHPRLPSSRIEIWQGVSQLYASKKRLPLGFFAKFGLVGRGGQNLTANHSPPPPQKAAPKRPRPAAKPKGDPLARFLWPSPKRPADEQ